MRDTNNTKKKATTEKPNFKDWYETLSKPSKKAFRIGVIYALKCMKDNQQLEEILSIK